MCLFKIWPVFVCVFAVLGTSLSSNAICVFQFVFKFLSIFALFTLITVSGTFYPSLHPPLILLCKRLPWSHTLIRMWAVILKNTELDRLSCLLAGSHSPLHILALYVYSSISHITVYFLFIFTSPSTNLGIL